ncbi:hypothetical protein VUR80DRAFT_7920 [Thermomyces stellatus]
MPSPGFAISRSMARGGGHSGELRGAVSGNDSIALITSSSGTVATGGQGKRPTHCLGSTHTLPRGGRGRKGEGGRFAGGYLSPLGWELGVTGGGRRGVGGVPWPLSLFAAVGPSLHFGVAPVPLPNIMVLGAGGFVHSTGDSGLGNGATGFAGCCFRAWWDAM